MVYLSSETTQCIFSHASHIGSINSVCGGMIVPSTSISYMLTILLVTHLVILPVTATSATRWQLASFSGLPLKLRAQMTLAGIAGFGNVVLFGLMGDGEATKFMHALFYVSFWALTTAALVEVFWIVFRGGGGGGGRGGAPWSCWTR
jgi:hypothetical protein